MQATSDSAENIAVELVYLARDDLHEREKPYKLQYDPGNAILRSNCANETHDSITVRDLRSCGESISFDANGFMVLDMESQLESREFYDESRVKDVYYTELKGLLGHYFGSSRVEILEHLVRRPKHPQLMLALMAHDSKIRKRHPDFPVSTGEDYEFLQPTAVVHTGEHLVYSQYPA